MLEKVVFIIEEEKERQDAVRARFCERTLRSDAAICLYETVNAEAVSEEMTVNEDPLHTLFATNVPALADALQKKGLYVIGLIEGNAAEDSFPGIRFLFAEFEAVDEDSYVKAYERMASIPWTILETARCIIRETTVADVDAFYEIYKEPAITKFMEGLFDDPEDERRYTADYIEKVYALMGYGVWTVIDKESAAVIGRAGFSLRGGFTEPEIGFLVAVPFQRQGYATEIIEALLTYGRDVLLFDKVRALVKDDNAESIRLLKRCGFVPEKEVSIEENIYGSDYTSTRAAGLSGVKYGSYLQMIKEL